MKKDKFWINKKLTELSHSEWEALCDNCGKCCVIKLKMKKIMKFSILISHVSYLIQTIANVWIIQIERK